MEFQTLTTIAFVAVMVAALGWDVATRRIPNALVLVGLLCALALRSAVGPGALWSGMLGGTMAFAITLPLFALRAMGGGDVKLFAAVGAFLGPAAFLSAFVASALVGGVLGIGYAVRRGVLLPVMLGSKDLLVNAATLGRAGERPKLGKAGALTVPYGAAIAIGSLAVWFLSGGGAW
ncbi:MAG: A24 family peptidase [Longimicrobiales bacterium]